MFWLMMLHHHTIFGNKIFCDSENIIRIKIQLHYLKSSNLLFPQNTLAYDDVLSDQVWLPRNQQFRKYSTKSHILIIWALVVTLTLKIGNFFSTWHSGSWCYLTITNLVTKYSLIQKTSSGQTFTDILNLCCDLQCCTIKPSLVANQPAV